jgi:hypothetical protein
VVNSERYQLPPVGHSLYNLNQISKIKENLRVTWHGVESLLRKAEKAAAGTPAHGPLIIINVLIDLGNVCPSLILRSMFTDKLS